MESEEEAAHHRRAPRQGEKQRQRAEEAHEQQRQQVPASYEPPINLQAMPPVHTGCAMYAWLRRIHPVAATMNACTSRNDRLSVQNLA